MNVLLLSTYDLGHQPFGLASPAAWLSEAGAQVTCNDLAVEQLNETALAEADMIACHLPMHTATRLATELTPRLRTLNNRAHLCFFGLYAPLNAERLTTLGADSVVGGEFEQELVRIYKNLGNYRYTAPSDPIALAKQDFRLPLRTGLPPLTEYAYLDRGNGERITVGYTEASRGCKHLCRHCPVVPVYNGRFRIVSPEIVIADIATQVAAGARHISFGDPDFFNGIGHARRVLRAFYAEFPNVSYDVTIKIEHLLKYAKDLTLLVETGCLFVTTATEAVDDKILGILDKGHSRADFVFAAKLAREVGLQLSPTFVPFTPWTTRESYLDLLRTLVELDLVEEVAPVQLAIRLLLPRGSLLLEHKAMAPHLGDFDAAALSYRWTNTDPTVDALQVTIQKQIESGERDGLGRGQLFKQLWQIAHEACGYPTPTLSFNGAASGPRMSEPWYCCAEPTTDQLARV